MFETEWVWLEGGWVETACVEVDALDPVLAATLDLLCPLVPFDEDGDEPVAEAVVPIDVAVEACALRLAGLQRELARLHAEQLRLLAHLDTTDESAQHWISDLVACIQRVSVPTARTRLARARTLIDSLPATVAAVAAGDLPGWHADTIADHAAALPTEVLPAYEARVLKRASTQTLTQLRQAIRRATLSLDPTTAEHRHTRAVTDRTVTITPLEDGMAGLWLTHSADAIQSVWERLCAARHALPTSDQRNADQQRADLLIDGLLTGISPDQLPTAHRRHPTIQVLVTAGTLLGTEDEPGWLAGYGPITATHARTIATDPTGTWQRILTDPDTSQLLDAGTRTYRPSTHLIGYLTARDHTCVHPTCNQPAHRTEIDHIQPWTTGGPTQPTNTALLCRRHNQIKQHRHGWTYRLNPDHTTTWTHHATGLQFTNHPPQRWPHPDDTPNNHHDNPDDDPDPPPF